jgi:hypothetical protein
MVDVVKRVRRTRNIGAPLGECVGNQEVDAQRNKRWREARLNNLASTMLQNASVGRETSERLLVSVASDEVELLTICATCHWLARRSNIRALRTSIVYS